MHENYQQWTFLSRETFLALLPSNIDQSFVEVVATGKQIRINDLANPVNAAAIEKGLRDGVYKRIERAYPRNFLSSNNNWRVDGVDPISGTANVIIFTASGSRHLVCSLVIKKPDPQI